MRPSLQLKTWQTFQTAQETERNRIAILNGPLPKNDPRLLEKIKVRVIRPFYAAGGLLQTPEMGIILIARFEAGDLRARGKVEILD